MDSDILVALGRLEGKVDSLIQGQAAQGEKLNAHDKRIRDLEQSKAWFYGVSATVGAGASVLCKLLMP